MTPLERAARAAWENYARMEGIRMKWEDLHDSAKFQWRMLASDVIEAWKEGKI